MNVLKNILKFILYAGAVVSCLAGLGVICAAVASFREPYYPDDWPYELAFAAIYVCLAFTPAFMLLMGLTTKTWHWVFIGIAEAIVVGLALFALIAFIGMALSNPG
ncbi:MAG TPA: hypothetical protein VNV43_14105 [Candidatus Acidoferrales bacterium]|jgi:hypothetical protein|nr:hypothetical protein [Candidatus Acidoferrales bacterium]